MDELKSCPFCGEEAAIKEYKDGSGGVYCTECKFEPLTHASYNCQEDNPKAIKEWNRRTPDISLSPDRLQEICKAEAEGRVVIPLKLGQEVYGIESGEIVVFKVYEYSLLSSNGVCVRYWAECISNTYDDDIDFWSDDIGKTVFLSKKEAEDALKEETP